MGAKKTKLAELDDRGYLLHMRDLKLAYRQTYWQLRRSLKEAESVNKDERGRPMEHSDIKHLKEAISDVNFAITWLHTGKQPGVKRGIERRSAYQREKLMDPVRMQAFIDKSSAGSPSNLSEWQRTQIEDALCRLSGQERACYEMKHGQGFSYKYISQLMGIKASTVENYVIRAQKKVSQDLQQSLFLWDGE